ncbi:hypothetical protein [Tenacibaculum sp. M341]|uniref:hypothetical protein n=1 Tax=Tenacibaculum sp. M341 TaxID=2530339 RepID=UPI001FB4491A|nr:hypothetical protein [Tenacibaculum sp. M341]
MRGITILILIVLFGCSEEKIVPQKEVKIDFVKTVGGSRNEVGSSVVSTQDNGYIILGYADSNDGDLNFKTTTDSDYFVLKYNANDELEWSKVYGGSKDDRGLQIIQTSDNGFAVFGFSESDDNDVTVNNGNSDFWITKLNTSGNIVWEKSFGFSGRDNGSSLIATSDNGFLLVGELDITASGGMGRSSSNNNRHAGGDYWAIKLNSSGDKEWSNFYGGNFTETPQDVVQTTDGFIITGFSDSIDVDISNNKGTYDFWVVKIDNQGKLIWEKSFGGTQIDESYGIEKTNDGNFVIVGSTRSSDTDVSSNSGGGELWLIKISSEGKLIWEKTFGGASFDVGRAIHKTNNGDLLIGGSSRSTNDGFSNNGENDAWVFKISSEGNLIWQKFIGGSKLDFLYDITELQDESIVAVGESTSNDLDIPENKGFSDLLIIKIK